MLRDIEGQQFSDAVRDKLGPRIAIMGEGGHLLTPVLTQALRHALRHAPRTACLAVRQAVWQAGGNSTCNPSVVPPANQW